jgi:hypothetical protein
MIKASRFAIAIAAVASLAIATTKVSSAAPIAAGASCAIKQLCRCSNEGSSAINHALNGAGELSAYFTVRRCRLAEEIAMSAICQYCNKRTSARRAIALSSTWHTTVWSG